MTRLLLLSAAALVGYYVLTTTLQNKQPRMLLGKPFKPVIRNVETGQPITPKPITPRYNVRTDRITGQTYATY